MTRKTGLIASISAFVLVAAAIGMLLRHSSDPLTGGSSRASSLETPLPGNDTMLTAIQDAKLPIENLQVRSSDGIVIVRGKTSDEAAREQATTVLRQIGVTRVANMIRVDAGRPDEEIARAAERKLVASPDLNGCRFAVRCDRGVLRVSGSIAAEHQRELAARTVRNIDGVREVQTDLKKL
jgi:osmotically-inducible protein OsmY